MKWRTPALSFTARERLWRLCMVGIGVAVIFSVRDFRWHVVWDSAPFLMRGLATSWLLAGGSVCLGLLAAIPLAWARAYGPAGLRQFAVGIIELVRATPELMIVFWMFFAAPAVLRMAVSNWTAGVAALSLIAAAHLAEVIRGGILSVPTEQWEAAAASGLSRGQAFVHVVLPQAARNMLPALIAQLVLQFKTTALVYVIGVIEFFRAASLINNAAFAPYAIYTALAAGYFVCCWTLAFLVRRLDPHYLLAD